MKTTSRVIVRTWILTTRHRVHPVLCKQCPETAGTESLLVMMMSLKMMMQNMDIMIQLNAVGSEDWVTSVWF